MHTTSLAAFACLLASAAFAQSGDRPDTRPGAEPDGKPDAKAAATTDPRPAIQAGLRWLIEHQDEDGSWDPGTFMRHDDAEEGRSSDGVGAGLSPVATTTLVLLALHAEGNTTRAGACRENVARAVRWLAGQQDENGDFRPSLPRNATSEHALATYALTVNAVACREPDCLEKNAAKTAIDRLLEMRNAAGLWGRSEESRDTNFLTTYSASIALLSAQRWRPELVPALDSVWEQWLKRHPKDATATGAAARPAERPGADQPGADRPGADRAGADRPGGAVDAAATTELAAGIFCGLYLGERPRESASLRARIERLCAVAPPTSYAAADLQLCWHVGMALERIDRDAWAAWVKALRPMLIAAQRGDGNFAGSWDPVGPCSKAGGRVYATVLAVLTLRSCHRKKSALVR